MKYSDLNFHAFTDTAENLVKLLKAYGSDNDAVQAMQDGVDGYSRDSSNNCTRLKGSGAELPRKNDIMADFRARLGAFGPQPPPPTVDMMKEIRDEILALNLRLDGLEKKMGLNTAETKPHNGKLRL